MLQTTNPFQHWRRITTDRKVEQTEPVRYPSMENGTKISAGISYKKLSLLEKRKMFLTELKKEDRDSSRV